MTRLFDALDTMSASVLVGAAACVLAVLVLTEHFVIQRGRT